MMKESKTELEQNIDKIIEKLAVLEMIVSADKDANFDINEYIKEYMLENSEKVKAMKKGLYVEFTGEIICRLDS